MILISLSRRREALIILSHNMKLVIFEVTILGHRSWHFIDEDCFYENLSEKWNEGVNLYWLEQSESVYSLLFIIAICRLSLQENSDSWTMHCHNIITSNRGNTNIISLKYSNKGEITQSIKFTDKIEKKNSKANLSN